MLPKILATVLLALLLASATMADQQKVCASCRKPITSGQYIEADGRYWHANHFVCAYCGRPIGTDRYFTHDGRQYDSACYVNEISARCAYCGQPVGASWVTFEGRPYHKDCYTNSVALRCSFCGDVISGKYLQDQWGNTYHEYHRNEPRCQYCGRLFTAATNGGERFSDGRSECGLCLETAVRDKSEAEKIMREVKATLASLGIVIDRKNVPLKLVDAAQLAAHNGTGRSNRELEGLTQWEKRSWLYGLVDKYDFDIYILHSLPRTHYYATVAHELMHVWLTLNAPLDQNSAVVEGTCNYAAYLVLMRLGDEESDQIIRQMTGSNDPDYGEGFRQVKAQVELRTLAGWLDYLRRNAQASW
ncbi:hypothetical protein C3F09_08370 [candidate division GN15 bacterium]|uniref:LIM zinc-binding domain-containing protein n=1 Tax=candidate division GN15 bacterium TaxID=2072418 RepID=A0A855X5N8_9BACT|nr:MAG: hypothetical protein C3F09_08370 [candidate division GN15 bacterium]